MAHLNVYTFFDSPGIRTTRGHNIINSASTFADDMTLLGLHTSALLTLIRCAYDY